METRDLLELLSDALDFAAKTAAILLISQRLSSTTATPAEREHLSRALGRLLDGSSARAALRYPDGPDGPVNGSSW